VMDTENSALSSPFKIFGSILSLTERCANQGTPQRALFGRLALGYFRSRSVSEIDSLSGESVQSCGQVMLTVPAVFGLRRAGSFCANDGMHLPESH
jgi:hypothetical protein